jgi:hypothetical protein
VICGWVFLNVCTELIAKEVFGIDMKNSEKLKTNIEQTYVVMDNGTPPCVVSCNYSSMAQATSGWVAISLGQRAIAWGEYGTWIIIAEWQSNSSYVSELKNIKAFKIDGKKLKANTKYKLVNNEAVEA